jgi:deoxyribose-phosphate aldolase
MQIPTLTPEKLAGMIDYTFLKPYGAPADIEKLCREARAYGFAMVAINPSEIERCVQLLSGSNVRVGAAIGFPFGQNTSSVKEFEVQDAIARGAGEIDMVINIRALQSGNTHYVQDEIAAMVRVCKRYRVISKVILETCYLTDLEKKQVCQMALSEGADFVKTSTGFGSGGATTEDIRLMRKVVGDHMGIKASGGIRDLDTTLQMIAAGATRIGTSAAVSIINEFRNISMRP